MIYFYLGAQSKLNSIYFPQQPKPQINIMDYASIPPNVIRNIFLTFTIVFDILQTSENMLFMPNYYTPTKTFPQRNEEKNELIVLQNKLMEAQKALNDEILKKTVNNKKKNIYENFNPS